MSKMVEILQTIYEFHNKTTDTTNGLYHVKLDSGNKYYLLRNNESVGALQHYLDRPASECVSIIRNDMREGFFEALAKVDNPSAL